MRQRMLQRHKIESTQSTGQEYYVEIKFLKHIRYDPTIDKYCVYDIICNYNKEVYDWVRLSSTQEFMKKYEKLFHYKKLNKIRRTLYIDYTVIPILLNWISPTLSYEFQNDLDKTEKATDGYVYLVQFDEDIEDNIIKIGRTYDINVRYKGKQYEIYKNVYVKDAKKSEKSLIKQFTEEFNDPIRGNEYFKCDDIQTAIDLFDLTIDEIGEIDEIDEIDEIEQK